MTRLIRWDQMIQRGRGRAAAILGQQYSVWHLTNQNNGIETGPPLYGPGGTVSTNYFNASITRYTNRHQIENVIFELLIFEMLGSNIGLNLGDVLVEVGYEGTGSNYMVAQRRPMRPTLLVRSEQNISVTRPNPLGGQAGQQPLSGAFSQTGYGGNTKANELICTLTGGLYAFQAVGTPASIPCGIQPQNRLRSMHKPDLMPTQIPFQQFCFYLPLCPGVQIQETDILNLSNQDRYEVLQVYQSDSIGLSGYLCLGMKMAV